MKFAKYFTLLYCWARLASGFSVPDFTAALTGELSIGWKIQGADISLTIEKKKLGHAAVGLGSSMADADLVLVENNGGVLTIKDCKLTGYSSPDCSETNNWLEVDKTATSDGFKVELKRTVAASEPSDKSFSAAKNNIIYSHSNSPTVSDHSAPGATKGVKIVDFSTGSVTSKTNSWGNGSWMKHEHTQYLLWTVVVDFFILTGRYLKKYYRYFEGHSWALLAVLIIIVVARDREGEEGREGDPKATFHKSLAVVLLILSILILINGTAVRIVIEWGKLHSKRLTLMRVVHTVLGVLCWVIARLMVFNGANMHRETYGPLLLNLAGIETAVYLLIVVGLEIWRIWNHKRWKKLIPTKQEVSEKDKQLISDIKSGLSIPELKAKYKDRNIFIFLDQVYDLGSYIHPGGQFIFHECRFREISRFMYGAVGLELYNGKNWHHSRLGFNLLQDRLLGSIVDFGGPKDSNVLLNAAGQVDVSDNSKLWQVDSTRKELSGSTYLIKLRSDSFKVQINCRGTQWMGKHFVVSNSAKARPYTICVSMSEEYRDMENKMFAKLGSLLTNQKAEHEVPAVEVTDYLPLVIKAYAGKRPLSAELVGRTSVSSSSTYSVEGPVGRGLEIPPGFTGEVVLIAAGTGVLPFADLLALLLKKAIYLTAQKHNHDASFVFPTQDYRTLFANIRFKLLCSFRSADDFVNAATVSRLHQLSSKHSLGLFECVAKIGGNSSTIELPKTDERFSLSFLQQHVRADDQNQLIMVCSTPQMQAELYKTLVDEHKVHRDRIIYV